MIVKYDKRFNEKLYILKLKNGMQVHILPKEEPYFSTYVELSMPFGSNHLSYEIDGKTYTYPPGSAHFMEHKIFAMEDGDAFLQFSNLGVDANAMTSYQQTSYMFNATSNVEQALKLLLDMLDSTYFTKENIDTERQIIAEELKMYLDDIEQQIYQDLMMCLYKNHPLKHDIGGTVETIEQIDKNVLTDIHQKFYHPSNRLLVIAGRVDIPRLKKFFKAYDTQEKIKIPKITYLKEPKGVVTKNLVKQKDVTISKLAMGYKFYLPYKNGRERVKQEMIYTILFNLLLGTTSNLYHELLERHYINKNFYISSTFENHQAHLMIFADTKDPRILKSHILNAFDVDMESLISVEAFNRYVKVYIGQMIFALNAIETKVYLYGKYFHKKTQLFDVIDIISDIAFSDIVKAFKNLMKSPMSTVIYEKAN
jgi:predicted Zn-dependent peptidase